ncbi:ANTAR domain-containing protein [Kineococcus sp. SYSU DK003]|uniref:ANTAR domain-containing protein n=1 Tax=Kineococcus sp. SYSU DK003 TaxID=3383124 RepID=UPI003D7CD255
MVALAPGTVHETSRPGPASAPPRPPAGDLGVEHLVGMLMLLLHSSEASAFQTLVWLARTTGFSLEDLSALVCDFVADGTPLPWEVAVALSTLNPTGGLRVVWRTEEQDRRHAQ